MYKLYGAPGCGSAIVEIMFILTNEPYKWKNVEGFEEPGPQRDALLTLNPLGQVPTLMLEDGAVMTETAAIALMLLDKHPEMAPPADTPERQRFYRLLVWFVANVYPTFTYGDNPPRWTQSGAEELLISTNHYREQLYLWLESQVSSGPYIFGEKITLLDAYPAAMINWRPRQQWFEEHTPKLFAIAQKMRQRKEFQDVLSRNEML
ncbi:glutathione S-transferase family protein [Enterobacteriaceae bacterium H20N1]|uniref:Glutathione S-transferase family protein n=1 Tax=Dryocola boscaweniae TaxID=2925397 RepID=A0A9X2WCN0_9ENTR|nr:glutathione S-transferase family protein [Dryocola boscaweniae]MCT4704024.1 glutathione S-transferase family protein [Dryocola boscaweniae]MCT4717203.1 glutathione S-transferase family protein [Dryocola boscaweniae]MCT4721192.1 glutathione S-transferase family protein [Dryocola boscaweniae]